MLPRRLPESGKSDWVLAAELCISLLCAGNVLEHMRTKHPRCRGHLFEHHGLVKYLAAVGSDHLHWGDLSGPFANPKVTGTAHIRAGVREVYTALSVMGKAREELVSHLDHLVGLSAELSHLSRQDDVLAIAKHPAKRIAGKRLTRGLPPGHHHTGIQSACQRYANPLVTIKIARE